MLETTQNKYTIQTVENALCLLEAISEELNEFGVSQLCSRLGLNKSCVFRMLTTFEQKGYVLHNKISGRYRVGLKAYETGGKFLNQKNILQKLRPVMAFLAEKSGEAVYLAIPDDKHLIMLEMVDSPQKIRVMSLFARRFPLEQFSAGKVIIAHKESRESLCGDLRKVLAAGACVDNGAVCEGVGSLAAPVFNRQGLVCASICILAPDFRLNNERIENDLLPLLKEAGEEISTKLGSHETTRNLMFASVCSL